MEIREFAEQVLYGSSLQDKFVQPGKLTDLTPGKAIQTPLKPGRPAPLRLEAWHDRPKVEFPSAAQFHDDAVRGTVLHFFANHELLAMELMALVLLRFPNAPESFRRGVAGTLLEEQQHMQKYMQRMQDLGVGFGEIPVNDFFWSCISKMQSPLDFVVQMSMTFEQANLDFALHYKNLFREFGDLETADILDAVYEDEIGHVKHGVAWFHKMRSPSVSEQQSEWEAYVHLLPFPLNPSRAKGLGYSAEARRRAGLSEHFIRELAVFTQSKGRPPAVYVFNPIAESEVANGACSFSPSKNVQMLCEDLESLPMFVAAHEDVVLVRRKPSTDYLESLHKAGFSVPEFVVYEGYQKPFPAALCKRKIGECVPWGWSPETDAFFRPVFAGMTQPGKIPRLIAEQTFAFTEFNNLYSKAHSAQWLLELLSSPLFNSDKRLCPTTVVGRAFRSAQDVADYTRHLWEAGFHTVVVKSVFGSSGQNNVRLMHDRDNLGELRWIDKVCASGGEVVAEPWLSNCLDLSVQLKVEPHQTIICGVTRFLTDGRGQYRGTLLGRRMDGLQADLVQFLYSSGASKEEVRVLEAEQTASSILDKDVFELLARVGQFVGDKLRDAGFVGPAGIDALVYRDHNSNQYFLKPVVEVNPRLTMGRVALELGRHLVPGVTGLWCHVAVSKLRAAGFSTVPQFSQQLQAQVGLECTDGAHPLIKRGVVFTQDPELAQGMLTFLLVEKNAQMCENWLAQNGLETGAKK